MRTCHTIHLVPFKVPHLFVNFFWLQCSYSGIVGVSSSGEASRVIGISCELPLRFQAWSGLGLISLWPETFVHFNGGLFYVWEAVWLALFCSSYDSSQHRHVPVHLDGMLHLWDR